MRPTDLSDEHQRLESLQALQILDSPREERFDRITRLAAQIFNAPVASLGFIDSQRLWFKSTQGMYLREASREVSFCSFTITSSQALIVPDARRDPRFSDNPTVTGEPHLRFYAGYPIHAPDMARVGSLCVVDYRPRAFTEEDTRTLADLASWAEQLLLDPVRKQARLERVLSRDRGEDHPRLDRTTRAWNRAAILEIVRRELLHAKSEKRAIGIILMTVDKLEETAQSLGSVRREVVLAELSQRLRSCLRPSDSLGRYGPSQFLAVLLSADLAKTAIVAERIREEVSLHPVASTAGSIAVTISVGVASTVDAPDADVRGLITAATSALERAESNGGNRTMLGTLG